MKFLVDLAQGGLAPPSCHTTTTTMHFGLCTEKTINAFVSAEQDRQVRSGDEQCCGNGV